MKRALDTALRLGRVSNLPTVWTNVMAGIALGGAEPTPRLLLPLGIAASFFYMGGMCLNDAFDRRWDGQHRPERPIPAGEVRAGTVFAAGFALLGAALALLALTVGRAPTLAGLALATLIVVYDVSHKGNPLAPVVMGLCRVSLYAIAALAVAPRVGVAVYAGAAVLLAYLVALTVVAKHETRNPRLPALVGQLIAGICLLDAAVLVLCGHLAWAAASVLGFFLTRRLARRIPGT